MTNFTKPELLVLKFLIEQANVNKLPENALQHAAAAHSKIVIAVQNIDDRELYEADICRKH